MDIGTQVIIGAFVLSLILVVLLKLSRTSHLRKLAILSLSFTALWAVVTCLGEFMYAWAGNTTCSKFLGCVDGFVGYDAFEHLFFGIAAALVLVWLSKRFPEHSILHSERWRSALMVVAAIALLAVLWEILECAHDALRVDILHESLRNVSIHVNLLDQPSNLDTMGDLIFSLVGAVVGFFLA